MGRIASSLDEGENQFLPPRLPKSKNVSFGRRVGLKRTSLRDSWKRKLLTMPKVLREKARQASLKRSPLKRQSKGLKAEQAKYWKLSAAFLARPENKWCEICERRRGAGENIFRNQSTEIHHKFGRLKRLLCYVPGFIASCRSCRDFPHAHPARARKLNLLSAPAQWNVFPKRA